ncbi:MAG TPA: nuclear transport factor 2 family protein [Pseudomonadales bacterium]
MDRETIVELIQAFYQSRLANSIDSCVGHFAANARLRIAGSTEASPIAGSSGPETLRRHVAGLVADWEWRSMEIRSLLIDGNRVAVHYRLGTRYVPTGDVISSEIVDLIEISDDGRIGSYIEFVDTAATAALAAKQRSDGGLQ